MTNNNEVCAVAPSNKTWYISMSFSESKRLKLNDALKLDIIQASGILILKFGPVHVSFKTKNWPCQFTYVTYLTNMNEKENGKTMHF